MENNIREQVIDNPYNEVYGILIALGNNFMNRIPKDILNNIVKNMDFKIENSKKIYDIPKYNLKKSLKIQGVSKEALSIIYCLYNNYWCDSDKELQYLQELIKNIENKKEKLKKEKYGNVDIFANNAKQVKQEVQEEQKETMLRVKNDNKWYKDIIIKLRNLFKRK